MLVPGIGFAIYPLATLTFFMCYSTQQRIISYVCWNTAAQKVRTNTGKFTFVYAASKLWETVPTNETSPFYFHNTSCLVN